MQLKKLMEQYKGELINARVAKLTGYDESTISLIIRGKYSGNTSEIEADIVNKLSEHGYRLQEKNFRVRADVFIQTSNVRKFNSLCDELSEGDLTSSFGVVVGTAGRGKTKAAVHYAVNNPDAVYVQFITGFSLTDVSREIAYELNGIRPFRFRDCLMEIEKATRSKRKIILIDEADKMHLQSVEMLRGLNERCLCPIVLIGEEAVVRYMDRERRLKSRVRQTVAFEEITLSDVSAYFRLAAGIDLDAECAKAIWKRSGGDFRYVVRDAHSIVRIMNTSNQHVVTMDIVRVL
ncbi:MAG: AAA family ATPase [Nitrospinae bacterium]|nr:AAA family ATPase [Nitrospinota bacterium]